MPSPQNAIPPQSKFKGKTRRFWDRVSEGMALHELWSQFAKDARSSYRFYSAGLDQLETQPSRMRRFWQFSKAMFWAILEKLTPARRILLLVGLALLFFSAGITYGDKSGEVHIFELDMRVVGGLVIFLVLLLELADRVVMKRDLEIAKDIQAWLLPGAPLQLPGYQIAYATRPANTVAGVLGGEPVISASPAITTTSSCAPAAKQVTTAFCSSSPMSPEKAFPQPC